MDLPQAALSKSRAVMQEEYGDRGWGGRADEIIALGWRRWCSYERRHKKGRGTFEERVEDLAKGLCSRLQPREYPVGADMAEYRWLASALGHVFTDDASDI